MNISPQFDLKIFNEWYDKTFKTAINIENEVDTLLNDIVKKLFTIVRVANREETVWSLLQSLTNDIALKVQSDMVGFEYDVLPEIPSNNETEFKLSFTKPVPSVINKMWRENNNVRGISYTDLSNIKKKMKDLVRFAVRTNSLKNSEILAQKFMKLSENKLEPSYKKYWDNILENIWVDTEMKTSTGYFAYHIYFQLKIGITVEMQIYSILSDSWKKLSHKIYEVVRDEINVKYNFNDVHSRIISIGHLLYLADCELYNLEEELKKENKSN